MKHEPSPAVSDAGVAEIERTLGLTDYRKGAMLGIEKDGVEVFPVGGVLTTPIRVTLVGRVSIDDAIRIQNILTTGDV
jgi:hypothetical protein